MALKKNKIYLLMSLPYFQSLTSVISRPPNDSDLITLFFILLIAKKLNSRYDTFWNLIHWYLEIICDLFFVICYLVNDIFCIAFLNISVLCTSRPVISISATNIFAALPLSFCSYDIVSKILVV